jgi:hypothetical protein
MASGNQHQIDCASAQQENTYQHIKKLESEEYMTLLENKHKHHAHCGNCTHHHIHKYTHKCKALDKIVNQYNICTRWRKS